MNIQAYYQEAIEKMDSLVSPHSMEAAGVNRPQQFVVLIKQLIFSENSTGCTRYDWYPLLCINKLKKHPGVSFNLSAKSFISYSNFQCCLYHHPFSKMLTKQYALLLHKLPSHWNYPSLHIINNSKGTEMMAQHNDSNQALIVIGATRQMT